MTERTEKSPAEVAADAAYAKRVRDARRRTRLAANVGVLNEISTTPGQRPTTLTAVASFYEVAPEKLGQLLREHHNEFTEDGWLPAHPHHQGSSDVWTDRAIVRAGLLLEGSETADYLRYRLGLGEMPVLYSSSAVQVNGCRRLYEKALEIVEDTRDTCPADLWRELLQKDHHELMGLVITLAALVPDDQPDLGHWLQELAGSKPTIARGLSMLVPVRSRLHPRHHTTLASATSAAHHPHPTSHDDDRRAAAQ